MKLKQLLEDVRACTTCAADLPLGPRPLLQAAPSAKLVIIGQAPGQRAHTSGTPWDDASGQRLREWLDLTDAQFYNARQVALMPMGFCYPGTGKSGDLPPRPECAAQWHGPLLQKMPRIELTVLIGKYAIDHYTQTNYRTLTDAVRDADNLLPKQIALPHPSPRNNRWLAKNPWFVDQVLPALRKQVQTAISGSH